MSQKNKMQEDLSVQERIIDIATPLFAMKGYAGVSVRELAKEAGVNIALISYYFGGKEKLYSHILSTQFERVEAAIQLISKKDLKPKDKIYDFIKQMVNLHHHYPFLMRLSLSEIINPTSCYDTVVKNGIMILNQFLTSIIKKGIETSEFREDIDPAVAALSIIGIMNFYFLTQPLSQSFLPEKESKFEYYMEQSLNNYLMGILKI